MDGFEANVGVIILAATNRPDVLDRALLRPGRFDRQVVVDAPDMDGREAILKVHARGKPLAAEHRPAEDRPGHAGLFRGRPGQRPERGGPAGRPPQGRAKSPSRTWKRRSRRCVAGPERNSRRLDEKEKRRVAYHEVGHALVAAYSEHADPVHKISIVPRGRAALGYTLQLPEAEQFLMTRSALLDRIRGMLGGRAAEEVVFNEVSTGAENDLERATILARQMVCIFGMSDAVGLIHCGQRPDPLTLRLLDGAARRDCSPETADQIDREVKRILDTAYEEAKAICWSIASSWRRSARRCSSGRRSIGPDCWSCSACRPRGARWRMKGIMVLGVPRLAVEQRRLWPFNTADKLARGSLSWHHLNAAGTHF